MPHPFYDSLGNLNYAGWAPIASQYPFGSLKRTYTSTTNFLNSNLVLSEEAFRGFTAQVSLGYNHALTQQQKLTPISSLNPATNPTGSAQFGNNTNSNWIVEPQINYNTFLGGGKISIMAGGTLQDNTTDGQYTLGTGYTQDNLLKTISNAAYVSGSDNFGEFKYAGIFSRLNYNWDGKYILNLSGRRDGSSKFGPGKEYGNFWAVGTAWIFSEEDWIKNHLSFLSFGKLRGSYGTTGSDNVIPYSYLTRWSANGLLPYNGSPVLLPIQHANPNYQWQVDKKLEGAIELGFLKDAINLTATWYRNRCGNQLVGFPTPEFTGFNTVQANSPALVQNQGEEFKLSVKIINTKKVGWSVNFNTAFNQNKLLAYPNLAQSPFSNGYVIGKPLNITKLLHYTGVDPQTGQYTFQDRNHDGTINTNSGVYDDRFNIDLTPKYFGGFGTSFNYKTLQLDLLFFFKKQIGQNAIEQGNYPGAIYNQPLELLNGKEWQQPGDIATVARYTTLPQTTDSRYHNSDAGYTDASYIRLRNVNLSYSLPEHYSKKAGMQAFSFFLRGENLFVITRYKGLDPEVRSFGGLQPAKTFTAGISTTF